MLENPSLTEKVTFEEFLEMKQNQMKAAIREMRVILGFIALTTYLGGKAEDEDEIRYMDTWLTRNLYKALTKGQSELIFMWNPGEFWNIIKNPLPVIHFLQIPWKVLTNTFDETRDAIWGENSPYDKTPWLYHTLQMGPGGTQILRVIEIFEQHKTSPYALTW